MKVSMAVNGVAVSHDVEPRTLLVQFLRDRMVTSVAKQRWLNV